jgi:hypothetical protein
MNYLAPAGEAGAERRVRDLNAGRQTWAAPGIKIPRLGAEKKRLA